MIKLEKDPDVRKGSKGAVPWTACRPFVENSMAMLIHRVKHVTTHKIGPRWDAHIAMHGWCGNAMTGTKKFTFLDAPPAGKFVCARCEAKATAAGMPSSSALAGQHVHLGGVVAVQLCCTTEATQP